MFGFIIGLVLFAFTVTVHEYSHGFVAHKLGDNTAKEAGRLSLNPIKHIDPFWTVILPLILVLIQAPFIFGMAKPVPVNFMKLNNPKRDMIFVAAAGPLSNIIFATILLYLYKITGLTVLFYMIFLNLLLGFFNLIPVPPLDGGRILAGLLPDHLSYKLGKLEPYGIFIVLVLLLTGFVQGFIEFCLRIFSYFIH